MPALGDDARRRLHEVLARAGELGLLGPGRVDDHIEHGLAVAAAIVDLGPISPDAVLDLGSGGGVPGLVVAVTRVGRPVTLLDGSAKRCWFLRSAALALADLAEVSVAEGRAEDLAHEEALRGHFGVVTARSFARPAVTAECAAQFLAVGGRLVVSEPPDSGGGAVRWDFAGLGGLGLGDAEVSSRHGPRLAVVPKIGPTDPRFPRRVGVPEKRPLW